MGDLYTRFDNTFFEKTRLSILTLVYQEEEITFNELKKRLGGTDGAIYSHLEKLIKGEYVKKKREIAGTTVQTVYTLTDKGKKDFQSYLTFLERMVTQMDGKR